MAKTISYRLNMNIFKSICHVTLMFVWLPATFIWTKNIFLKPLILSYNQVITTWNIDVNLPILYDKYVATTNKLINEDVLIN